MSELSWAERACAALAGARVASLQTGDRWTTPALTVVSVEDAGNGLPRVWLDASAPAVAGLASCRVATLAVAGPTDGSILRVRGSFRMEHPETSRWRAYVPTLLSARLLGPWLGESDVRIPVEELLRAGMDPWRYRARAVLDHLAHQHGEELLAHVHRLGHAAQMVVPQGLDGRGIDLALLGPDGVASLRLSVSGEAARLPEELAHRVGLVLDCATAHRAVRRPSEASLPFLE